MFRETARRDVFEHSEPRGRVLQLDGGRQDVGRQDRSDRLRLIGVLEQQERAVVAFREREVRADPAGGRKEQRPPGRARLEGRDIGGHQVAEPAARMVAANGELAVLGTVAEPSGLG